MWCTACNVETNEPVCPICGNKGKVLAYKCSNARVRKHHGYPWKACYINHLPIYFLYNHHKNRDSAE